MASLLENKKVEFNWSRKRRRDYLGLLFHTSLFLCIFLCYRFCGFLFCFLIEESVRADRCQPFKFIFIQSRSKKNQQLPCFEGQQIMRCSNILLHYLR